MEFSEAKIIENVDKSVIRTNGVNLTVYQAGQGGIPLVLAHGWPELSYSWRFQIPALVAEGYHVIVPDQRGYGDSDKPEGVEAYDIHNLTADQVGILDALGIEKAVYVGHDWGAIMVWAHSLLHPERVMGVANLSVPFMPRGPNDPVEFWEKMLGDDFYIVHFNRQPEVAAKSFHENTERFLRNIYRTKQWLDESPTSESGSMVDYGKQDITRGELAMSELALSHFVEVFEKNGFIHPCAWYRNFSRNWETTANVEQKVSMPALMIYGEHDMVPKTDMTPYVDDLEIQTLECGHWIQQEKPEETNTILAEWLNRKMKPLFASGDFAKGDEK